MPDDSGTIDDLVAQIVILKQQVADAAATIAGQDKTIAAHADMAAKLDRLMGTPAEPGISIFQKYRTDADNAEHPTLAGARLHLAAITLGISTAEARRLGEVAKANPDAVKMLMEAAG